MNDFNKLKDAIINYERCRQEVGRISKQRSDLISCCQKERVGYPTMADDVDLCLKTAMKDLQGMRADNWGESYSYHEILQDGLLEGYYCQNCYDSYMIKIRPLAEARQKLGNAKRSLSMIGKSLLKTAETTSKAST